MLSDEAIAQLKALARRGTWTEDEEDDFNPYDMSGGNFDDCYEGGRQDGETETARMVLAELGIGW